MVSDLYTKEVSRNVQASCFYDSSSVLNANGTLVRVVKLSDFRFTTSSLERMRSLCKKVLYSGEFRCLGLWINVVRSPIGSVRAENVSMDGFAAGLSDTYHKFVEKENRFSNEVFISIVSESALECAVGQVDFLLRSLLKRFDEFASKVIVKSLEDAVAVVCTELAEYQPVLLCEAEVMNFLSALLGISKTGLESGVRDISTELLSDRKVFFGFNTFEIHGDKRTFGTSFSVKSFRNLEDVQFVARFLGAQNRMVITEVITRTTEEDIRDTFEESLELTGVVNDTAYQSASSKDIIAEHINEKRKEEFCKRSFKVTLFADSLEELGLVVANCEKLFSHRGFMIVRDDLLLEDTFWGNLPGNFSRMRKWEIVLLKEISSFAFTHAHFRSLLADVNKCLTKFVSLEGELHYFSFPDAKSKSHAIIFGKEKSSRIELQNFLLLESVVRLGAEFLIVDDQSLSEVFVHALEGSYIEVSDGAFRCNLLDVADVDVLYDILSSFCSKDVKSEEIAGVAKKISEIPLGKRSLTDCAVHLQPIFGELSILQKSYGHLFTSDAENGWLLEDKLGFSVDKLSLPEKVISSVTSYVIARYIEVRKKSGKPFIIVIQSPTRFKRLFSSLSKCESFLCEVSECGGMILFSSENTAFLEKLGEVGTKYITTRMFLPLSDTLPVEYNKFFTSSASVMRTLDDASLFGKCFFLNQGGNSVILKFDSLLFEEMKILSSCGRIEKMRAAMREAGNNPAIWLPIFCRECN
ncbi:VirB4 family type IV secretion system protein [Neorickettsia sennetsu]|uniref:Type IV secretion system protein VirB4 n=1 Tax=Ehrlichia sennetsu (strain ATCC VR-367 / Miyayama) TaxID=222891 RepID=Q2GD05_EHRS3|nr:VirB4 family type IV secretion system protein [Neorickettsia sennetsu]ABD45925.1 type IV secretion system protein VirB4 [Neorickettsia sennetsu str. Miyayama]